MPPSLMGREPLMGGSATGVLITDSCHETRGDFESMNLRTLPRQTTGA